MRVSAAGHYPVFKLCHFSRKAFCVLRYLFLVGLKFRLQRFFKTDRLSSYYMYERPSLGAREYFHVYLFGKFFPAHYESAARPPERLVRRRCNELCIGNRVLMDTCRDQPCYVRYVH